VILRRTLAWLTVAAALLIAVVAMRPWSPSGYWQQWTSRPQPNPPVVVERNREQTAPPISVDGSLSEAKSMVVSLTRRTADETVEPTRKLLPIEAPASPLAVKDKLPKAIEPATQSLEEIRQGASSGLEPMANSARRAINMFWREVTPPTSERKPDF
jgi:hypothetical protein